MHIRTVRITDGGPRNHDAPLHLRILAYHCDRIRAKEALPLELLDLNTVLMPRQWFLKKLDPDGKMEVPQLREILEDHMLEYKALVLMDRVSPGMTVKKALSIYKKWHVLKRQPSRGTIPFSCSCALCFAHCVCQDTILLARLPVRPERAGAGRLGRRDGVEPQTLQDDRGTAGRKRRKLIEERACDEKDIDPKVKFLKSRPTKPEPVLPSPEETITCMPSSDDDFEV